jgi:hypothetical protein
VENEPIQIGPLARAYLAAVRAGHINSWEAELQLTDGCAYILRNGLGVTTADVLRVIAALCEAVAELKDEDEVEGANKLTASVGLGHNPRARSPASNRRT